MSDDPFYTSNGPPAPPRQAQPCEFVFEFYKEQDHSCRLYELRDDGEVSGVEAQFYRNEVFEIGRRFERRMDPTRTPQEMTFA